MSKRYFLPSGLELLNVHDEALCAGRVCIIHNSTDHHMVEWRLLWRQDRGIFERICEHGTGHPDPDQFDYWVEEDMMIKAIHGCDFCCYEPETEEVLF